MIKVAKKEMLVAASVAGLLATIGIAWMIQNFDDLTGASPKQAVHSKRSQGGSEIKRRGDKLQPGETINLNTAQIADLQQVPYIGKALAEKIVDQRERYGRYKSVDELLDIQGIKEKQFDRIKEYLTVE